MEADGKQAIERRIGPHMARHWRLYFYCGLPLLAVGGLAGGWIMKEFHAWRANSAALACQGNIDRIHTAMGSWYGEQLKGGEDVGEFGMTVKWEDLVTELGAARFPVFADYDERLATVPRCPSGYDYILGPPYEWPLCASGLPDHDSEAVVRNWAIRMEASRNWDCQY